MEFAEIKAVLLKINTISDVAESHAIASGMLIANISANKISWIKQIMGEMEQDSLPPREAIEALGRWFEAIKQQLDDSNLRFDLCLPDEDQSLVLRITAVQEWCRGFILGIAMSGIKNFAQLPEDSRDLLTDFSRIGTEEEFELDDSDEAETAYNDISQYVRIGVLLMYEELRPLREEPT
ncbi:MAG: YecA family protein [Cocleimonas sp.]|nr:YecA family protein [Cocleimonas sp.]